MSQKRTRITPPYKSLFQESQKEIRQLKAEIMGLQSQLAEIARKSPEPDQVEMDTLRRENASFRRKIEALMTTLLEFSS